VDSQIHNDEGQSVGPNGNLQAAIPVLIVGGGPIGLSTSLLLSHHGIRSLLVEQHPGTSTYPKARLINSRTMEIFRQLGIEQTMREVEIPHARNVIYASSLAGTELMRRPMEKVIPEANRNWSPTWGCTSTQEIIESVLLAQARRLAPAHIRFGTQLASFEQGVDHVLATLVHRPSGRVQRVRAQYLIGTDGSHSTVREALGIRMLGQSVLSYSVSILFRADLSRWVGDREINMCIVTNPDASGMLINDGGNRWRFTAFYNPANGESSDDFTSQRCVQVVRAAVGAPDLNIELYKIAPWNDAAQVAERFYDRRVFLAGDAAQQMSPAGGFGMNTGIQEAHNLAWKLAAVLKGWAVPALLDSYESERAPIARVMTEQIARNMGSIRATIGAGADSAPYQPETRPRLGRPESHREHGLIFGVTYDSAAIVPDGTPTVQLTNPVTDYVPNARPGNRAPHVWLERDSARISTLDLFDREFVLLTGAEGRGWCEAAQEVSRRLGVPLQSFRIGRGVELNDPGKTWAETYGIEEDGAVLVRPDGYVAWRCTRSKPESVTEIDKAWNTVLGRRSRQPIAPMS
jgi:2-polyprenyl-6-methoxyphenol hydroxylase-like FAD-dependent oxidoreductase